MIRKLLIKVRDILEIIPPVWTWTCRGTYNQKFDEMLRRDLEKTEDAELSTVEITYRTMEFANYSVSVGEYWYGHLYEGNSGITNIRCSRYTMRKLYRFNKMYVKFAQNQELEKIMSKFE